jgi:hypothetical protein
MIMVYLASWGGLIAILTLAMSLGGNPQKMQHGLDYQGRICGVDAEVRDVPYAAWIAMPAHLEVGADCTDCYQIMTCISDCSETLTSAALVDKYESSAFLHFCMPSNGFAYNAQFQSSTQLASRSFADLYTCWPVLLGSSLIAILVSFLYTWFSRRWAGWMVSLACLLAVASGALVSYLFFSEAVQAESSPSQSRSHAMWVMGAVSACCTLALILFLVVIRKQLKMAVKLVREASKAILQLPWLVVFPFVPVALGLAYLTMFVSTTVLLATTFDSLVVPFPAYIQAGLPALYGAAGAHPTTFTYSWHQSLKNSFAFVLLHLLWSLQILIYTCYTVVGCTISSWYFAQPLQMRMVTETKKEKKKRKQSDPNTLSDTPVWDAIYMTLRFHMGTVILGALIMAVVNFVRAIVAYLQAKAETGAWSQNPKSCLPYRVQSSLLCLTQCMLTGLSCCMQQLNHFTFLWTGLFGDSFCPAAQGSFGLVFGNAAHTAVLNMVGAYLMLCGKLFVSAATTAISGLIIVSVYRDRINSLVLPLVVIFIISFTVAAAFMTVLETGINAIFFDFLVDEDMNASSGMMHASKSLQKLVYKEVSVHEADQGHRRRRKNKKQHEEQEATQEDVPEEYEKDAPSPPGYKKHKKNQKKESPPIAVDPEEIAMECV